MLIFTYEVGNYRSCCSGSVVVYLRVLRKQSGYCLSSCLGKGSTRVQKGLREEGGVRWWSRIGREVFFVDLIHQWR